MNQCFWKLTLPKQKDWTKKCIKGCKLFQKKQADTTSIYDNEIIDGIVFVWKKEKRPKKGGSEEVAYRIPKLKYISYSNSLMSCRYCRFPNFAGDETALAAAETISGFDPLIGTTCSSELSFFLCSVYFPMCTEKVSLPIGPCRPLCLRVHKACSPLLKEFNYKWPSVLDCDKFPAENTPTHMCMGGPENSNNAKGHADNEELTTDSSENENDNFRRPADISTFHYASESGGMIVSFIYEISR